MGSNPTPSTMCKPRGRALIQTAQRGKLKESSDGIMAGESFERMRLGSIPKPRRCGFHDLTGIDRVLPRIPVRSMKRGDGTSLPLCLKRSVMKRSAR